METRGWSRACLPAVLLALVACGGGSGGSDPDLSIEIDFPAPWSYVEGASTPTLTVRGRAESPDAITGVEVNGVSAESDDGFATWQAVVPVNEGAHTIEATAFSGGVEVSDQVQLETLSPLLRRAQGIARDPASGTFYIADATRLSIVAWHPGEPGKFRLVAGENRRAGIPALPFNEAATRLEWDESTGRLLYLRTAQLLALDPVSGEITVLADNEGAGAGPELPGAGFIGLGAGCIYLLDVGTEGARVFCVDPGSGNREIAFEQGEGDLLITSANAMAVDAEGERLFVALPSPSDIAVIDLNDGTHAVLETGLGNAIQDVVHDAASDTLYMTVNQSGRARIYSIAMETGERSLVSMAARPDGIGDSRGEGLDFGYLTGLELDAASGTLHAVDQHLDTVVAVDIESGDREAVVPRVREGADWIRPEGIAFSPDGRMLRIMGGSNRDRRIVSLPLEDGVREVFADEASFTSTSGSVDSLDGLVPIDDGRTLYVKDYYDTLYRVDGESAAVSKMHDLDDVFGPVSVDDSFAVDSSGQVGYFLLPGSSDGEDSIAKLNLETGESEIISGPEKGDGEPLTSAYAITRLPESGRLVVSHKSALVFVDPETGDREFREFDTSTSTGHIAAMDEDSLLISEFYGVHRYSMADDELVTLVTPDSEHILPGSHFDAPFVYDPVRRAIFRVSEEFGTVNLLDLVNGEEVILAR